ncbi:uncharacterized protein B0H18DRAFT_1211607 [Fomitopsis serialis]|uniref:uncharacterized protein n=1 Tax=Fomitopsis serialis TaxID=139415 RepID=UPI0020074E11|nr:uncharacterized protein B0H18DRAFT_1211607 [Neoantrodia serialis]KAH9924845.1 hypothetical protein B0H18DRAFT_1211607 [Neoantrodia serialis]
MDGGALSRGEVTSSKAGVPASPMGTYNDAKATAFPISAAREEPYDPRTPRYIPPATLIPEPSVVSPAVSHRILLREKPGFPGILEDGRWTVRHPHVQTYLMNLGNVYAEATGFTGASTSRDEPERYVYGCIDVGRIEDVGQVIGATLDDVMSEAVLTLAALEVMDTVRHPAHFALWGVNVRDRTIEIVKRVQGKLLTLRSKTWDRFSEETQRILQRAVYPEVKAKQSTKRVTRAQKLKAIAKDNSKTKLQAARPVLRERKTKKSAAKGSGGVPTTTLRRSSRLAPLVEERTQTADLLLHHASEQGADVMATDLGLDGCDTAQHAIASSDPKLPRPTQTTHERSVPAQLLVAEALLQLSTSIHPDDLRTVRGDSMETSRSLTAVAEAGAGGKVAGTKRKASEAVEDDGSAEPQSVVEKPRRTLRSARPATAKGKMFAAEMAAAQEKAQAIRAKRAKRS